MSQPALDLLPVARATDPATSHDAARAAARRSATDVILRVLSDAHYPLIGDEIAALCVGWNDGTVKTALTRLRRAGLVENRGTRSPGQGRPRQMEWALVEEGR